MTVLLQPLEQGIPIDHPNLVHFHRYLPSVNVRLEPVPVGGPSAPLAADFEEIDAAVVVPPRRDGVPHGLPRDLLGGDFGMLPEPVGVKAVRRRKEIYVAGVDLAPGVP
eukprot:CAMPEP_0194276260 /NCGR_PEP_ID=MMETSP0169-20130528/8895_1 /TAXON_ID=218684 /ORGANISM="Corethron pennatum, Strain L29A3" /LENGTH=108 /DNA_ID=CAMNT_0039019937 /DNA_START=364 /DNA_END=687 /DNA_ORIENTATION=-